MAIVATEPTWIAPERAVGVRVVLEVDESTRLEAVIEEAVRASGVLEDMENPEYWKYFWLHFLIDPSEDEPRHANAPRAVVAADGQALWIEGAKDRVVIGDLLRTSRAGLMQGDPLAVFLEQPSGGDGYIPTWADFIRDMVESGVLALAVGIIKASYKRWQQRGARTPYGFVDLVFARTEWNKKELGRLLGLKDKETTDLLEAFGYEPTRKNPELWKVSKDRERTKFRRKLRHEDE